MRRSRRISCCVIARSLQSAAPPSSAALIARMGKKEAPALGELHTMWSPVLLGVACRMLGDKPREDFLRDTLELAFEQGDIVRVRELLARGGAYARLYALQFTD